MLCRGVTVTDKNIPLLGYSRNSHVDRSQQKLFEEQTLSDKDI